ncbi:hypothetical protein HRW14_09285 [Streptomyces lunaelactis]|uniref:hypothetical protein n=1 Tax=Streptomyces lunaelactis TaxID=1535768 RepID=UPI0015844DE7|nr:hypothetical protein [Streptomyces lunaelactis]NUK01908.1 hypothetical protein [Streptomyces lunaelactis]NUK15898.1 hypothetical protein [Streptomyces lunaelactis]NUK50482.1 hypothetical protein [Streptomyces lunaelactis]NUK67552.1 hypothetical protein [Streptomyces lunaelactis]
MTERAVEEAQAVGEVERAGKETVVADSLPALVLLVPATMLLRYLGEHGWAYWTAAVLGGLGMLAAMFAIVASVRNLIRGRRRLVSGYISALLLGACFVLVARLVES